MNVKTISIVGMGHVGLSSAVCIADKGFKVIGVDVDPERVKLINRGKPPLQEPDLEILLRKAVERELLQCTTNLDYAIEKSDISFITVGTPGLRNGSIDLRFIEVASRNIGKALKSVDTYHVVVVKSTVTPGTTENFVKPVVEEHSGKHCVSNFGLCANPEFLREGSAINDTLNPDRIVIGEYDKKAGDTLENLYKRLYRKSTPPILRTSLTNAELIKYASNTFLATKISFINTIANLCERIPGADVSVVAKGMGLDKRISPLFLEAGFGYGGSCFPKDLKALIAFSRSLGYRPKLIETALKVNEAQPRRAVELTEKLIGDLKNKRIAILGLSFKPKTDDLREAPSTKIVNSLIEKGAKVTTYDPVAMANAKKTFGAKIKYVTSAIECIKGADCCIIVTEWEEFKKLTPKEFIEHMKTLCIIDGRRMYDPTTFQKYIKLTAIGLG